MRILFRTRLWFVVCRILIVKPGDLIYNMLSPFFDKLITYFFPLHFLFFLNSLPCLKTTFYLNLRTNLVNWLSLSIIFYLLSIISSQLRTRPRIMLHRLVFHSLLWGLIPESKLELFIYMIRDLKPCPFSFVFAPNKIIGLNLYLFIRLTFLFYIPEYTLFKTLSW